MWSIAPAMGIVKGVRGRTGSSYRRPRSLMYKTTNRGKLLKNSSNYFSNKTYFEILQIGERYGINALHIRAGIKRRWRWASPARDAEAPFTAFVLFLNKGFKQNRERAARLWSAKMGTHMVHTMFWESGSVLPMSCWCLSWVAAPGGDTVPCLMLVAECLCCRHPAAPTSVEFF